MYAPKVADLKVAIANNITLVDQKRDRQLPLKIYYPQATGLFPVIIFSHGAGGSKEAFTSLSTFLASCGYICIHPTHYGNNVNILRESGIQEVKKYVYDPQVWQVRPLDIAFIIDSFDQLHQQIPVLKGQMDSSRLGISGHSFGAYVTMLLAGATVDTPWQQNVSYSEARATAFLAISPQGTGQFGLNPRSWQGIKSPVLTISGSKDRGWEKQPPAWRLEAFRYLPRDDKYHLLIAGANHFSYGDRQDADLIFRRLLERESASQSDLISQKRVSAYIQTISVAFWDAYFKQENTAKEFLLSNSIQASSQGEATVFSK
jgi:predicted dienelactone hydrolase